MYYFVMLVLLVELHFVHFPIVLVRHELTLIFREFPIQHRAERTRHERHRRGATIDFDIHQIRPLDFVFNLHAYSIRVKLRPVNKFRSVFFSFFGREPGR